MCRVHSNAKDNFGEMSQNLVIDAVFATTELLVSEKLTVDFKKCKLLVFPLSLNIIQVP